MAPNPDPRPGRWLLPLVVLGMVVFTYVFVRALPGAEADPQDLTGTQPETTTTTTTVADDATTTTAGTAVLDPAVQGYLDQLAQLEERLTGLQAQMATINSQWDSDPREITYAEAEQALADLAEEVRSWASDVAAISPPEGLASAQDTISQFASTIADAADAVVEGLRAPDTGEQRRAALDQFDQAVLGFTAAIDQAEQAARTVNG